MHQWALGAPRGLEGHFGGVRGIRGVEGVMGA